MDASRQTKNGRSSAPAKTESVRWHLRPGDFRPEPVDGSITRHYPDERTALEQLSEAGNLFDSERDAIDASIAVRAELNRLGFIRRERQGYGRQNGMRPDNNQPLSPAARPRQTYQEGIRIDCGEPQSPSARNASRRSGDSFQGNGSEINVTVQIR